MRCWKKTHMGADNARKMFDIPLQSVILFSIPSRNTGISIENLPNVLTTPQQLKNRKNEPAHCIHARTPPLDISEVGLEGKTSGIDFSSLLLPFSSSSAEAMFLESSKAYLLLKDDSPGWM